MCALKTCTNSHLPAVLLVFSPCHPHTRALRIPSTLPLSPTGVLGSQRARDVRQLHARRQGRGDRRRRGRRQPAAVEPQDRGVHAHGAGVCGSGRLLAGRRGQQAGVAGWHWTLGRCSPILRCCFMRNLMLPCCPLSATAWAAATCTACCDGCVRVIPCRPPCLCHDSTGPPLPHRRADLLRRAP